MTAIFTPIKINIYKHLDMLDFEARKYVGMKENGAEVKKAKAEGRLQEEWRPIILNYNYVDNRWFSFGSQTSVLAELVKGIFSLLGHLFTQKQQQKKQLTAEEKKKEEEEATSRQGAGAVVGGGVLLISMGYALGHFTSIYQNQKKTLAISTAVFMSLRSLLNPNVQSALAPVITAEHDIDSIRIKQVTDYLYATLTIATGGATLLAAGLMKNTLGMKLGLLVTIGGLFGATFAYAFHKNDEATIEKHYRTILDFKEGAAYIRDQVLPHYTETLTTIYANPPIYIPPPYLFASAPMEGE